MKNELTKLFRAAACCAVLGLSAGAVLCGCSQSAKRIEFGGVPDELTISEVSDHTVRVALTPLDETGKPRPERPTYGFVDFPKTEKLRLRELSGRGA